MSLPASYFDAMYARDADPWSLRHRWYEQRKYAITVGSLPQERYRNAFEPGCSIGVLSELLAPRCDRLLCVDRSAAAVGSARERLAPYPQVRVEPWSLPAWPDETFDLVILSEVGYYFDEGGRDGLIASAVSSLEPGGHLVAVHWRPVVADYPATGDQVHQALADQSELARIVSHTESDFILEVFARTPPQPRSVAQREGLW